MSVKPSVTIYILEIMKNHIGKENAISQNKIRQLLEEEYEIKVDPKTIRHNLEKLIQAEYPIMYTTANRTNRQGKVETIKTGFYYDYHSDWDPSELKILVDSLLFSNFLPHSHCKGIIRKIATIDKDYEKEILKHADSIPSERPENRSMFFTINSLIEAINKNKQVCFSIGDFDLNLNLKSRKSGDQVKKYIVNPYKMASANGRYYLLGNTEGHNGIFHFRIDRIIKIEILNTPAKSLREIKGFENGLTLSKYLTEHPNMWSGTAEHVSFRCPTYLMNDIIDWFGKNVKISKSDNDLIIVRLNASKDAMLHWAIQYADAVEILSPSDLRSDVIDILKKALDRYK